ncbi:MAG: sigma 54-interacting transcriptional regulator [Phycisphaerae bacterium]|nr:sigma 54-interacting transcriptional regulator [Phycisphaerae bacterium]
MKTTYDIDQKSQLGALYSVADIIGRCGGQKQMLQDVLDLLEAELAMHRGTIMLLSLNGEELMVEATKTICDLSSQDLRYQRGEGITGRVLATGKAVVVPSISREPQFRDRIHRRKEVASETLSFICVPISVESEVVGTLAVDLYSHSEEVLLEAKRVLSIVAAMIANNVKSRRDNQRQQLVWEDENLRLRAALGEQLRPENIIGNSHAMRVVYEEIHKVAATDTTVLIRGESGTGKELVASAIHFTSARADKPFVKVNCAALSETLLESELFGHEKGAFTGALQTRIGRLEQAQGGTLFLDEIGDFSPSIQIKLLRVLQEKEFERVGSNETHEADIRILTATNRNLEVAVESNAFRQDLYYRVNVFPIFLPPLRERKGDILMLADFFAEKYGKKMDKPAKRISTSAINMMLAYHWPGNVRELENCIERAVLVTDSGVIHGHHLPPTLQIPQGQGTKAGCSLKACVNVLERDMIIDALKRCHGNISAASRELGITSRMTRYKIKKLGIEFKHMCV